MKRDTIIYPFLFILYPILHLYARNHREYAGEVVVLTVIFLISVGFSSLEIYAQCGLRSVAAVAHA